MGHSVSQHYDIEVVHPFNEGGHPGLHSPPPAGFWTGGGLFQGLPLMAHDRAWEPSGRFPRTGRSV